MPPKKALSENKGGRQTVGILVSRPLPPVVLLPLRTTESRKGLVLKAGASQWLYASEDFLQISKIS